MRCLLFALIPLAAMHLVPCTLADDPPAGTSPPRISSGHYEERPHFVVKTSGATYWLDQASGGLSRLIDRDGIDWIAFKTTPWNQYPDSAASAYRGLPNLVIQGPERGFGHPGWDRAVTKLVDKDTIVSTSLSGKWQLRWDFTANDARLTVEKSDPDARYWFLYEGPIAGSFAPHRQYFATDVSEPRQRPHDYYQQDRVFERWRWAYFGDTRVPRVLFCLHEQKDETVDTFSHLGNSKAGLKSPDGMVVFGFGRGPNGIEPLLQGRNSFRIGFLEGGGDAAASYAALRKQLDDKLPVPGR